MKKRSYLFIASLFMLLIFFAVNGSEAKANEVFKAEISLNPSAQVSYQEFVNNLEDVDETSVPKNVKYYNNYEEAYEDLCKGTDTNEYAPQASAKGKFGHLWVTAYCNVSNGKIWSMSGLSSYLPAYVLGGEWVQNSYSHSINALRTEVYGTVYGTHKTYIYTPIGGVKIHSENKSAYYHFNVGQFS